MIKVYTMVRSSSTLKKEKEKEFISILVEISILVPGIKIFFLKVAIFSTINSVLKVE